MFLSKGSVIILLVVIATCIHVNSGEGLRKKRQSGSSGTTSAPSPTTTPASSSSDSSSSSPPKASSKGLLTILGDGLGGVPVVGTVVSPLLYFLGGMLGGIIGILS